MSPHPLDYQGPNRPRKPPQEAISPPTTPVAIPIEFDLLLTQTDDHAGIRAIETALRKAKISFHRTEQGDVAHRIVELHIRSADRDQASQIAGRIWARRNKLKSFPPPPPPPPIGSCGCD